MTNGFSKKTLILSLCTVLFLTSGCQSHEESVEIDTYDLLSLMSDSVSYYENGSVTSSINIEIDASANIDGHLYEFLFSDSSEYVSTEEWIREISEYSYESEECSYKCSETNAYGIYNGESYMLAGDEYINNDFHPSSLKSIPEFMESLQTDSDVLLFNLGSSKSAITLEGNIDYPDNYRLWRSLTGNIFCSWSTYFYPDNVYEGFEGTDILIAFNNDDYLIQNISYDISNVFKAYVADAYSVDSNEIEELLNIDKCACEISFSYTLSDS